jgi:aryl-alcohol dehydrogenase-like predicted oxidoreductase
VAARFVLRALRRPEGGLLRSFRAGSAGIDAFLEDYAYLGEALVDLYEAGGAEDLLHEALALAEAVRRDFAADDGGFYSTAAHGETLVIRPREGHDGATPSANAKAASLLARLGAHFGRDDLRQAAERALGAFGKSIARHPRAFCFSLMAADFLLEGPVELAFVGGPEETAPLRRAVAAHYLPNRVAGHLDPDGGGSALPLLAGKARVRGRAALFVCRDFACQSPVTEPDAVAAALLAGGRAPAARLGPAPIAGRATPEGTARYAARHAARLPHGFSPLGSTGLTVSRLGFGGYRVDDETPAHRRALAHALAEGVNLVDSSTNYTDGGSERLVGEVLRRLLEDGTVRRDEVVIVSKIGYVQGANLELALQREREQRPFPEMVKYGEGIWHCLHPEFLEDQLGRSRARLGVETLDVCLLHNPEYFLKDEHERSHGTLESRRQEFDARLRAAFAWLEGEVAAGRLGAYGVSSNTVASPADDPEATSLERMLSLAPAGGHFRVLQLPMNLLEAAAVRQRNQAADRTVLDAARTAGVGVLVNRPLNAFRESGLVRLADPPAGEAAADWEARLERVAALEDEFAAEIASYIQTEGGSLPASQFFRWAQELRGLDAQVKGADHWDQLESQRIVPRVSAVLQALDQGLGGALAEQWGDWRGRYLPELQALLSAARGRAAAKSARSVRIVRDALEPALPAERRAEPLSRLALWVLASTPGVGSVLVGMRRDKYVDDALPMLAWPPLEGAAAALARTSSTVED